jgi:hypothetical protein
MFSVQLDTSEFTAMFARLRDTLGNDMQPFFQRIGEHLLETTKLRFDRGIAPDGSRWAPNSPVTILCYLEEFRSKKTGRATSYTKDGRLNSKGVARVMAKRPLIGCAVCAESHNKTNGYGESDALNTNLTRRHILKARI